MFQNDIGNVKSLNNVTGQVLMYTEVWERGQTALDYDQVWKKNVMLY